MLSNTITLTNAGEGMLLALEEAEKAASAASLPHDKVLELRLITEEMMAMLRSVTGELTAKYWLEWEGQRFTMHLSAKSRLSNTQRRSLVDATTSGRNEAVVTFMDKLRDVFEQALAIDRDVDNYYRATGYQTTADITDDIIAAEPWDKFEKSLLLSLADEVRIGIKGGHVDMTIEKQY